MVTPLRPAAPRCDIAKRSRRFFFFSFFFDFLFGELTPVSCARLLFFSGEQFLSDKLLLHARRRSSNGRLHGGKNRGGRWRVGGRAGGLFRCPLRDITSLRGALLCAEMRRLGGAMRATKGVGWRRRSINIKLSVQHLPTLCGDPSNDTSRSLQPNRFREHDVENRDMLFSVCQ